jgi:peptidoglycan/xylan/chitin deacetylase (PgdA/CDA1 family)
MHNNPLINAFASPSVSKLMSSLLGQFVTIYMMHRPKATDGAYEGTNPELLESYIKQAQKRGFHFASVEELVVDALSGKKQKHPTLSFTLDDGYQDQLDVLVPVLLQYNCKPTLFVIADMIDTNEWPWDAKLAYGIWNTGVTKLELQLNGIPEIIRLDTPTDRISARRQLTTHAKRLPEKQLESFLSLILPQLKIDFSTPPKQYQPASWKSLQIAEAKGLNIGSHGCSHRVFSSLTNAQIIAELERAKQKLAEHIKNPSRVFCYPSGKVTDFSHEHSALLKETGYIGALSSVPGNPNYRMIQSDPFNICRHSIPNNMNTFIRYTSWLEYLRSKF